MQEEKYWILVSKKIAGEATSEELDLLQNLVNDNPEWKTIMENLQELWNSKPFIYRSDRFQKADDAYLAHINRLKERAPDFETGNQLFENKEEIVLIPARRRNFRRFIVYSVSVFFLAGMVVLYLVLSGNKNPIQIASATPPKPVNEITISQGSRSKIQLPDGSQVWINSGSKLTYENSFKGTTREVKLDGEAYFDVVKDAAHPFIVHTSGIDIKVLGTAFNVKAYNIEPTIEATLIHGSIEVINKNQPGSPKIMLKPHEKLVYNKYPVQAIKDQRADIKPAETDAYSITIKPLRKNIEDSDIIETAWVYNKLVFEDERLEDLALKMEKWYNLKINIENEKLKNYKVSGSFVNETAEEAFRELQFLVPINYSINNNEIVIVRK
jgi:ferric-dicitrate binding protein FerR (iron transport regulator)